VSDGKGGSFAGTYREAINAKSSGVISMVPIFSIGLFFHPHLHPYSSNIPPGNTPIFIQKLTGTCSPTHEKAALAQEPPFAGGRLWRKCPMPDTQVGFHLDF
jgi:hypothetical protein